MQILFHANHVARDIGLIETQLFARRNAMSPQVVADDRAPLLRARDTHAR